MRAWRDDASHNSIAQKVAGAAFLIRVVSAALVFGSQILFARWMGSFEFGIYVYVWAWVLVIGEFADLGLASAAQRFIPEYSNAKAVALLRGFISRSRWLTVGAPRPSSPSAARLPSSCSSRCCRTMSCCR